jgi:hypothetical protein
MPWGTVVTVDADYASWAEDEGSEATYGLYVTGRDGDVERICTWEGTVGQPASPTGTTDLAAGDIARVDVRMEPAGPVLLEATPPPPPGR